MDDIHEIFSRFKEEFPEVYKKHEELGKIIHEESGPLPPQTRWLIKIAISAACGHQRALETHIRKALASDIALEEIKHALLLMISTAGFPSFMKAYTVLNRISK